MELKNDLFLRAAAGESVERPPVWLMRQAGRILPQYRKVRASVNGFKALVENPELVTEVTIQPVDELNVDAAIIFSDILVIPEGMGLPYTMVEKVGPRFPNVIENPNDIESLRIATGGDIQYTIDAIRMTKAELNGRVPLIGFAGAPWTIFSYMVEGGGSKTFSKARRFLYQEPKAAHLLLAMITESTINYLKAQIAAGVDLVQIFDSWAGVLTPEQYKSFAFPYVKQITEAINEVPVTIFAKGAYFSLEDWKNTSASVIGLDWNMNIAEAREIYGETKTLQGNLDPCLLYADPVTLANKTKEMVSKFGKDRYIANLGHGVYPDTPLDNVTVFVNTILEL